MVKAPALPPTSATRKTSTHRHYHHSNNPQNQYSIPQPAYKKVYHQFITPYEVYFKLQPIQMANDLSTSGASSSATTAVAATATSGVTHSTPISIMAIPNVATVATSSVTVPAVPATTSRQTTSTVAPTIKNNSSSKQQLQHSTHSQQQPSIHIAPPPPRLALHHLHPLAPIAIQANPNPWPIVEPVFHFGPGFDHQHYCPTHSQGPQPHEYVVFFHVNAGVSVTFQISGNREVIRGKC